MRQSFGRFSALGPTQERERIRDLFGESKASAGARWEQELARLFYRSGWTQEELSTKEGKSETWVQYRLRFGRFLLFSEKNTTGVFLTETSISPILGAQRKRERAPAVSARCRNDRS
jgi:hypothetical protein